MMQRNAIWCHVLLGLLALHPVHSLAGPSLAEASTEELSLPPAMPANQHEHPQALCHAAYPYQLNLEQLAQLHTSTLVLRSTPAVSQQRVVHCLRPPLESTSTYYLTEQTLTNEQLTPSLPANTSLPGNGEAAALMTPTVPVIPAGLSNMSLTPALVNGVLSHH